MIKRISFINEIKRFIFMYLVICIPIYLIVGFVDSFKVASFIVVLPLCFGGVLYLFGFFCCYFFNLSKKLFPDDANGEEKGK